MFELINSFSANLLLLAFQSAKYDHCKWNRYNFIKTKRFPKIAHHKAGSNILGLSEYSKLKLIMQLLNYASNGIIIKRLEKRFLLRARGNDEHTMLCGKWHTMNRQARVIIVNYDYSYAYGNLGAPFFPRDTEF